jgi:hypothetical protein
MNIQIPGMNIWLIIFVLVCAVVAIVVILILLKLYHLKSTGGTSRSQKPAPPRGGEVRTPGTAAAVVKQVPGSAVPLTDLGDITQNVRALAAKYGLEAATIATTDGLVIATTSDRGPRDAAQYSHLWNSGTAPDDASVRLLGLDHRGSSAVGIIRSNPPVSDQIAQSIQEEAEKILSWGL